MANYHHVTLVSGLTGQVVEFYPGQGEILGLGAPASAATYQVFRGTQSNDATPVLTGTATLSTISTTVSTASGYSAVGGNRHRVTLTSTTGIVVGERYLLANAEGQREIVIPTIVTTTYVDSEEPLAFDYAITTSTFKGLRHYFTIDATFIQDVSSINMFGQSPLLDTATSSTQYPPYRVEWSYSTGSVGRKTWTTFDVARQAAKSILGLDDLQGIIPEVHLSEWSQQRGQAFQPQLDAARRDLNIDIRSAGYDPDQILDPEIDQRLLLQKWAVTIGKGMLFLQPEISPWLAMVVDDYTKMFEKLIGAGFRAWIATTSTGAITVDPPRQLWMKGR